MFRKFWMRPHSVVAGLIAAVLLLVGLVVAGVSACTSSGGKGAPQMRKAAVVENKAPVAASTNVPLTPRSYRGASSAGDFLSITVTPESASAGTISYTDVTNHRSSAGIPYAVGSDGGYVISDPDGVVMSGYEIPGAGLVLHVRKGGTEDALVVAGETSRVTLDGLRGSYNTMRFRTKQGGITVGSAEVNGDEMRLRGYSPLAAFAARNQGQTSAEAAFENAAHAAAEFAPAADGTYLSRAAPRRYEEALMCYFTRAEQGFFLAATPEGAVIGVPQAESAAFESSYAGTYQGMYYQKTDVEAAPGGAEIATPIVDPVEVSVGADGMVTLTDASSGGVLAAGTLKPLSEAIAGSGKGMFTFRVTVNGMKQDFFAAFAAVHGKRAMVFSSFWAGEGGMRSAEYNYFYGVGLKGM